MEDVWWRQRSLGRTVTPLCSPQVFVTVHEGCIQLYASQTERYPSPKRANSKEYGYLDEKSVGGCAFKGRGDGGDIFQVIMPAQHLGQVDCDSSASRSG